MRNMIVEEKIIDEIMVKIFRSINKLLTLQRSLHLRIQETSQFFFQVEKVANIWTKKLVMMVRNFTFFSPHLVCIRTS